MPATLTRPTAAQLDAAFAEYVAVRWLTVARDDRGWYVTHDEKWVQRTMRAEGWVIEFTGESQLMWNDESRTYFTVRAK